MQHVGLNFFLQGWRYYIPIMLNTLHVVYSYTGDQQMEEQEMKIRGVH